MDTTPWTLTWNANIDVTVIPTKFGFYRIPGTGEWNNPEEIGQLKVVWEIKPFKGTIGEFSTEGNEVPLLGDKYSRSPKMADIVSFGEANKGGHVGFYLSNAIYISVTSAQKFSQKGVVIKFEDQTIRRLYRSPN